MELKDFGMGAMLAFLMIDKFIQYAKIFKDKQNGNYNKQHSTPCNALQALVDKINENHIEELKAMNVMNITLARIEERTSFTFKNGFTKENE